MGDNTHFGTRYCGKERAYYISIIAMITWYLVVRQILSATKLQKEAKEYLNTCLIKLLTQQNLFTTTINVFSRVVTSSSWDRLYLGFIDNLKTLFYTINKKLIVAVWLSSYNGTRDACRTLGYRLVFYTHFSCRYTCI